LGNTTHILWSLANANIVGELNKPVGGADRYGVDRYDAGADTVM